MADIYVAIWGNDNEDGLTPKTAKRTLLAGTDISTNTDTIHVKGYYNEYVSNSGSRIMDGAGAVIGGEHILILFKTLSTVKSFTNFTIRNFTKIISGNANDSLKLTGCTVENGAEIIGGANRSGFWTHNTFNNITSITRYNSATSGLFEFNTFFNIPNFKLVLNSALPYTYFLRNNIFAGEPFELSGYHSHFNYNLFIAHKFKFTGGGLGADEATFEYPIGADDDAKLEDLKSRMVLVYGGVEADYLEGCQYYSGSYNDIFIDADNGNFFLKNGCVAAHMSYDLKHIGGRGVGTEIPIADFVTKTNFEATGEMTDQTLDSEASAPPIQDFGKVRIIEHIQIIGEQVARNGVYLNFEAFLGADIAAGAPVLTDGEVYYVKSGTVTLDNAAADVHNVFSTFTATDEGAGVGLGFTGAGIVQHVDVDKYTPKVRYKCSKTDATLATAPTIALYVGANPQVNLDAFGEAEHGDANPLFNPANGVVLSCRYRQVQINYVANQLKVR